MSKLLRSPLFQFLLIGAVLAGAWSMIPGAPSGRGALGEDVIRVDAGRLRLLEDRFTRAFQRPPTDEERAGLVRAHIREEALYRAARELQLDRDDPIVRRRLNQKMEFLLEPAPAEVVLDDADLQRYLDENAERFLQPMQIALEQVHLRPEDTDPESIAAIRRALAENDINALPEPRGLLPPTMPLASIENVERRFGRAFAERLTQVPVGEWTGPVESPFGLHFVRVDQRTPERLPPLDAIRDRVAAEARAERRRALQEQRIDEVIARFEVIVEADLDLDDSGCRHRPRTGVRRDRRRGPAAMTRVLHAVAAVLALAAATIGHAHELRPSLLVMNEGPPGVYDVQLTVSSLGPSRVYLTPQFPEACQDVVPPTTIRGPGTETQQMRIDCGGPLDGHEIGIDGLEGSVNDVLVRIRNADDSVQTSRVLPESPRFEVLGAQSALEVGLAYGTLGMHHILLGLDHLLFVLALLLLIRSVRTLVATITAFTAAHSVTLVLSALGLANAPQGLVEALVALSIVFVAVEVVHHERGDRNNVALSPWRLAFVFGLLHGLGFGGALAEIGLPDGDVPLALLAFNLGVEAGQLLIVGLAIATVASLRKLLGIAFERGRGSIGYAIGVVSGTWFAQRAWGILAAAF